jgi:hypothetical protein
VCEGDSSLGAPVPQQDYARPDSSIPLRCGAGGGGKWWMSF